MTGLFYWIASGFRPRNDGCGFATSPRHCEQSEAIQEK
jgi:hypothetical protein